MIKEPTYQNFSRDINRENKELSPIKICTHQGLVDFFSLYADLQTDPIDFKPSKKAWAKKQADATWQQMAPGGAVKTDFGNNYYLGIYDGDTIVATGQLDIIKSSQGVKPYGYICHDVVKIENRGAGLAKRLTASREEIARNEGCDLLAALVNTGSLSAILTKLHGGFVANEVRRYSPTWTEFLVTKSLVNEKAKKSKQKKTLEVELSNVDELQSLLEGGYVGTDVKETSAQRGVKEWVMILEK